jgi:cell division protein FtsL
MAKRKRRSYSPGMLIPVGLFLGLLILVLLYVGERVCAVQCAVRVDRQRALRDRLAEEVSRLRIRHARLSSSERIERQARSQLGMISPAPGTIIYLVETPDGLVSAKK